ncbi:hypothetical protein [Serratia sp. D1N4]
MEPLKMNNRKPEDIKINEGLAKVHKASELISEDEINRLAEKAKEEAKINMDKHDAKKAQNNK